MTEFLKRFKWPFGLVLIWMALLFFAVPKALAFEVSGYLGQLEVREDNTAIYKQEITYNYEDDYNGQYVTIGTAGDMPAGFAVDRAGIRYRVYKNNRLVSSNYISDQLNPNDVIIESMGDGYRLKIYNSVGYGDKVKVQVMWPFLNMLYPYQDIAELNWVPISNWDVPLNNIRLEVTAPNATKRRMEAHTGYLRRQPQVSETDKGFVVNLKRLGAGRRLELHGYWNRDILSEMTADQIIPREHLATYEKTEANIVKNANLMSQLNFIWLPLATVVVILIDVFQFQRFKRKKDLKSLLIDDGRLYEIPEDYSPIQVARTVYNIDFKDINPVKPKQTPLDFDHVAQATIVDLIDRGYLEINQSTKFPKLVYKKTEGLTESELALLNMAFGDAKTVTMSDLFGDFSAKKHVVSSDGVKRSTDAKRVRSSGQNLLRRYNEAFARLREAVEQEHHRLELPEYYRPLTLSEQSRLTLVGNLSLLLAVIISLFFAYMAMQFGLTNWLLVLLAGVLGAVSVYLSRKKEPYFREGILTEDGFEKFQLWHYFENMLRDIGQFEKTELEAVVLWNRILVFATLFGYAKQVSRVIEINDIQLDNPHLNTYVYRGYAPFLSGRTGGFSRDVSAAREASHFNVSSGGSGGGFSSGGFSGGGGGGGGGSF